MPDNAESIAWEPRIRQNIQGQGTFIEVPPENRPGTPRDRGRTEGGEVSENILKCLEKFGLGLRRQRAILMARPQRRQRDIRGNSPTKHPSVYFSLLRFLGTKLFPGTQEAISTPFGGIVHRRVKRKKCECTVIAMRTVSPAVRGIQQAYYMFNPAKYQRSAVFDSTLKFANSIG